VVAMPRPRFRHNATGALLIVAIVIGLLAMLLAAYLLFYRPSAGKVAFTVWRMVSREAHGGQYASINGVRIYYETYGAGRPVLVLHGGGGALEDMHYQIRALAAARLVIAADSRGQGRSGDADAPLSYQLMADDMLKLMDHLHIQRTDVVGWSDGGIIALDLAMHHPERVGRLVVIGANYDVDGLINPPVIDPSVPDTMIPPVPRGYARDAPDPTHWPVIYRKVLTMWATQPHYTMADLETIEAPVLVMAGEFDVVKREHTDRLAHAIPNGEECIIPGGNHNVASARPDIVNARILNFIGQSAPR
jgi:pimeloyl-ACP methyl ester carboxylesterase